MTKQTDLIKKTLSKIADKDTLMELYNYLKEEELKKIEKEEQIKKEKEELEHKVYLLNIYKESPEILINDIIDNDPEVDKLFCESDKLEIKKAIDSVILKINQLLLDKVGTNIHNSISLPKKEILNYLK